MKKERILTCIVCPKGCTLRVSFSQGGSIENIEGYTCRRGITYATDECTHPRRTVTTTVRLSSGDVLPVKSSAAVPRELVFDIMRVINSTTASGKVKIGDKIIENVLDTGVDIIATANSR